MDIFQTIKQVTGSIIKYPYYNSKQTINKRTNQRCKTVNER